MPSHLRASGRTGKKDRLNWTFQRKDYGGTKGPKGHVSSGAGGNGEGEKPRRGEISDGAESSSDNCSESSRETEDHSDAEDGTSESDTGDSTSESSTKNNMSERNTKGSTSESDTEDSTSENEAGADGMDGRSTRKHVASQLRFRHSSNIKGTSGTRHRVEDGIRTNTKQNASESECIRKELRKSSLSDENFGQ